uniref:Ovule protein n=1 Tax=Parascaris univalens TaxID=6257 RepID=A0A915BPJ1_PARUN
SSKFTDSVQTTNAKGPNIVFTTLKHHKAKAFTDFHSHCPKSRFPPLLAIKRTSEMTIL